MLGIPLCSHSRSKKTKSIKQCRSTFLRSRWISILINHTVHHLLTQNHTHTQTHNGSVNFSTMLYSVWLRWYTYDDDDTILRECGTVCMLCVCVWLVSLSVKTPFSDSVGTTLLNAKPQLRRQTPDVVVTALLAHGTRSRRSPLRRNFLLCAMTDVTTSERHLTLFARSACGVKGKTPLTCSSNVSVACCYNDTHTTGWE